MLLTLKTEAPPSGCSHEHQYDGYGEGIIRNWKFRILARAAEYEEMYGHGPNGYTFIANMPQVQDLMDELAEAGFILVNLNAD